jgi:hypothetical protein
VKKVPRYSFCSGCTGGLFATIRSAPPGSALKDHHEPWRPTMRARRNRPDCGLPSCRSHFCRGDRMEWATDVLVLVLICPVSYFKFQVRNFGQAGLKSGQTGRVGRKGRHDECSIERLSFASLAHASTMPFSESPFRFQTQTLHLPLPAVIYLSSRPR